MQTNSGNDTLIIARQLWSVYHQEPLVFLLFCKNVGWVCAVAWVCWSIIMSMFTRKRCCVWVYCRVLRRAGILPAGVWLCRLRRNFGRFLPAGKFCWFSFLPAGDHRASLKRLKELEHSRFPLSFCWNKSSCLKAHLFSLSVRVAAAGETITKAESMRVKSRASDAECPEALPVCSVLHELSWSRSSSLILGLRTRLKRKQDGIDDIGIFRSARAAVSLSIAKEGFCRHWSSRVLSSSWGRCVRLLQVTFFAQSDRTGFSSSFLLSANVENFAYLRRLEND